jgi:hypothetical protein
MDYKKETETFHLSYSLYTDDFELALRKQTGLKIEIGRFSESNEKLIFDFIINHFSLKITGVQLELTSVGYELENDKTWVYIESTKIKIPESTEIRDVVLFKLFSEQKNWKKSMSVNCIILPC